jgi:hypothetical protein
VEVVAAEMMLMVAQAEVQVEEELYTMLPILLFPVLSTILLLVAVAPGAMTM